MEEIRTLSRLFQENFALGKRNDDEISRMLERIFFIAATQDYELLKLSIRDLSRELHSSGARCTPYLVRSFFRCLEGVAAKQTTYKHFSPIKFDEQTFLNYCKQSLDPRAGAQYRISTFQPKIRPNDPVEMYSAARSAINYICSKPLNEHELQAEVTTWVILLCITRYLANEVGYLNEFYLQFGACITILNQNEHFQIARDFSQDALLGSFNDKHPAYGLLTCFRTYTDQRNIFDALIFGNLLFNAIFQQKEIDEDLKQQSLYVALLFARNFGFFAEGVSLYERHIKTANVSDYDRQKADLAYFYFLLEEKNDDAIKNVTIYLQKNLKRILHNGRSAASPWFALLNNIKEVFADEFVERDELRHCEEQLEAVIGSREATMLRDKILAGRPGGKDQIKASLKRLSKTRNRADVIHETNQLVVTAKRVLKTALLNGDIEGILLAHLVNSDGSMAFMLAKPTEDEVIPLNFDIHSDDEEMYNDYPTYVLSHLMEVVDKHFIWLGALDDLLYAVCYRPNTGFRLQLLDNCTLRTVRNWLGEHLPNLGFEETRKEGRFVVTYEDFWEQESLSFRATLPQFTLDINEEDVVFFFDVSLSPFPHNLIRTKSGELISEAMAVCNGLSLHQYIHSTKKTVSLDVIDIWAPVVLGDLAISLAYSKLKDLLRDDETCICEEAVPMFTTPSDVRVFIAHGGKDGAFGFQGLFPAEGKVFNSAVDIFGPGVVAVLFVCHSASIVKMPFSNACHTLIKELLMSGYQAVVAPSWSLNIAIPAPWFRTFLDSMRQGASVLKATRDANLHIQQQYKLESAWAAMHLFGDPDITGVHP